MTNLKNLSKLRKLFVKYEIRRNFYRRCSIDNDLSFNNKLFYSLKRTKLPYTSLYSRRRPICVQTYQHRSVFKTFNLSRWQIKKAVSKSQIPGLYSKLGK